jgi:hypothetical protein
MSGPGSAASTLGPMEQYRRVDTMVAGGRYELYSNYPLQIQAVAASIIANA